jgi:tetratricopeptide (TPR) repeat protein
MAARIFINYRREESTATAGRLHDRLGQSFGRKTLFMDVDHIPPGVDFVTHLNNQVAACDVFLAIIGPNWLNVTNEKGDRRLDAADDFVAIEIAAALARNIRVIPVLVDGARMPKVGELPKPLKPLVRRQAIDLRHTHFGRDAEALIEKIGEALGDRPVRVGRWRVAAGVVAALLLLGWIGLFATGMPVSLPWAVRPDTREQAEKERSVAAQAEEERKANAAAETEARAKAEQAEKERLAGVQAEEERKAKAEAEAEAQRRSEEAERQRLDALRAEEERRKQAEAEARARYSTLMSQGHTDINNGDYDGAIAAFSAAMRLDPKSALAFTNRGVAYERKGDMDRRLRISVKQFDWIPTTLSPQATGVSLMREKATTTEPLRISMKPFASILKAFSALPTGALLMEKKAILTEPLPITSRRFDSILRTLSPLPTGASLMEKKATTTERLPISTKRSDSILITLSPFSTGASLMEKKATTTEPLPITARRSD